MDSKTKVLYDLSFLGDGRISGVERYSVEIYQELKKSQNIDYTCIIPRNYAQPNKNVRNIRSFTNNKLINHMLVLPLVALIFRFDFAYFPSFPPSILFAFLKRTKIFRVIHDDVYWSQSDTLAFKAKYYLKPIEEFWIHKYDRIITVSNYSKTKLASLFNMDSGDIEVVSNAVSFTPPDHHSLFDGNYILCVGTIEPRKNYPFAIDVFEKLVISYPTLKLKICGRQGWGYKELIKRVELSPNSKNIELIHNAQDEKLRDLYMGCKFLLFPSKAEGFGIPLIEAMAFGKHVIASNNTAITEVVSNGGALIDGYHLEDWSKACLDSLQHRSPITLNETAIKQANVFSWHNSYLKLSAIFDQRITSRDLK